MANIYSPSMIKTFEKCPYKFFLKYRKNISMPVDDEIFETGKNIHSLASYYLKKENIDNMEKALTLKEKTIWKYLKDTRYFQYEVIGTEYSLIFNHNGNLFSGRLDALVKNYDYYYILDYKTGTVPQNARLDYQTIIYLFAVKEFFNTDKIKFVYLNLKEFSEIIINLDDILIKEATKKLNSIMQKINSKDFQKNLKNCPCDYKLICY